VEEEIAELMEINANTVKVRGCSVLDSGLRSGRGEGGEQGHRRSYRVQENRNREEKKRVREEWGTF